MSMLNSKGLYNCECCLEDIAEDCEVEVGQYLDGEIIFYCERCFNREQGGLIMAESAAVRNIHE